MTADLIHDVNYSQKMADEEIIITDFSFSLNLNTFSAKHSHSRKSSFKEIIRPQMDVLFLTIQSVKERYQIYLHNAT